ncbi:hypothetical protein [Runella slithyformis]|uniref:Uncharacterized protein n=1 Tax=Runella slithyformis (strain ATCC 29530 / DSM 19594 / LMG 11500 / NCIMB 11436 / LSU 4) TaxID=761193 RepID=A0A7U4E7G2_RUNSL|nr:hypothetical protein [Runella slithyformis]AEI50651.1 hypothetical protein Runsl_4313 [Runella slithyformis DSM 19594]
MEWEELKNTWKQVTESERQRYGVSEDALKKLIRQRSQSLIDKMLRNFYGEMGLLVVCFAVIGFLPFPGYFRLTALIVLVVLIIPFIKPFFRLYELLKKFHLHPIEDLHRTLQRQVMLLKDYLKLYRRTNLILTPIAGFGVIWGIVYFFLQEKIIPQLTAEAVWITFTVSVLYALACIPFVRWYVEHLYGKYVERLEGCLKELEEKNVSDL